MLLAAPITARRRPVDGAPLARPGGTVTFLFTEIEGSTSAPSRPRAPA
jgi:hypothetical protein